MTFFLLISADANMIDVQVGVYWANGNCKKNEMHDCALKTTIRYNVFQRKWINCWKHSIEYELDFCLHSCSFSFDCLALHESTDLTTKTRHNTALSRHDYMKRKSGFKSL